MKRVFNFAAGPATLAEPVLAQVRDELLDWRGTGMSVMEMSHRDKPFMSIAAEAEKDLRELLAVPANYKVLFMQGGATTQFAAVPMNLLRGKAGADYVVNGAWGKKAAKEAGKYCKVNVAARCAGDKYDHVPDPKSWKRDPGAAYLHYTPNETIEGVEFQFVPDRRLEVRPDLRRRAEERRPLGPDLRHRARRPARPGPPGAAERARLPAGRGS
jgi:phosphoserine aminotransferase